MYWFSISLFTAFMFICVSSFYYFGLNLFFIQLPKLSTQITEFYIFFFYKHLTLQIAL